MRNFQIYVHYLRYIRDREHVFLLHVTHALQSFFAKRTDFATDISAHVKSPQYAIKTDVLAKLRAEHASILGPELQALNPLPYTVAVIKEVMRLYPAMLSPRSEEPGISVLDVQGRAYLTEGLLVWDNLQAVH